MKRILRRLVGSLISLVGAVTLVFLVLRLTPGDPADNILGDEASVTAKAAFRAQLGLDQPLHIQYGQFWSNIFDGSLGTPFAISDQSITVSSVIADVLPATIELAVTAMIIAVFIAIPFGILAAVRQNQFLDHASMVAALIGVAMPVFWLGPMLLYLLTVKFPLLPDPGSPLRGPLPLLLPALVLGAALSGKLTRMVRASVLDVLREDYTLSARAKGLSEVNVLGNHVLRNALIPVLTVMGLQLAALLGGAIVTEKVFARPGIGTLLLDAIIKRDYAVVQGCVIVVTVGYVLVNLAVDLLYVCVDPRVKEDRP
jgi:peptide/nickel transport system permease protein